MPFYRYQAKDNRGRVVEGTLEASDQQRAAASVASRGLRLIRLTDAGQPRRESSEIEPPAPSRIHKTPFGRDKDRLFLFSQIASYLKAGVNPVEAFARMGQNWRKPAFKESLEELGSAASEGKRLSEILASYPYLYPPHVVGIFKVGEIGGIMPEACEVIANQAEDSHRFRRSFWLMGILVGGMVATIPIAILFVRGAIESFRNLETSGNLMGLLRETGRQLLWPVGPVSLAALIALYLLFKSWGSLRSSYARHRIVLRLPTIGKRAKAESISLFTWALGRLTRAGMAPRTAMLAAAEAMPNLELRSRIEAASQAMSDSAPVSTALQGIDFLPPEAAPMVATGEMTGDLPSQLGYLERMTYGEFENENDQARKRVGCWVILVYAIGVLFMIYLIYSVFYGAVFDITNSWTQ
jgi:type II secretory pathway component PulF